MDPCMFTCEDVKDVHIKTQSVKKPTQPDQYLLFDSRHPPQHKLSVIKTQNHQAKNIATTDGGKAKEKPHKWRQNAWLTDLGLW